MKKTLTTLLLFTFVVSVNAQQSYDTTWKTLDGTDYSIRYPANWEVNQSGQMGSTFVLFSPVETNQDRFRENVNFVIQNLSGYHIDSR